MKFGVRKPSLKKSIKARTTGKAKRKIKKAINPTYGKKGTGYIRDPKKAVYNKVYNKTTVGVNPLSSLSSSEGKKKSQPQTTHAKNTSYDTTYTKYKVIDKEVAVTNPIELLFRRLLKKESIETKTVQEKVIVEQYTYGEIESIQANGQRNIEIYNDSARLVNSTVNPEVFFLRLSLAEESLEEVVRMIQKYSFLTVEGDNLKEALATFKQDKNSMITDFVDRHYEACMESTEKLKTERGKQKRYYRNYQELVPYFAELSERNIDYVNRKWEEKVSQEALDKPQL